MSVTLSLALNMRRMLSTNNLVRKMHACETMGAITVICTDKTGTLTQNLMQVARTPAGHNSPNVHGITSEKLQNAAHICWATGGALVPEDIWEEWFKEYKLPR